MSRLPGLWEELRISAEVLLLVFCIAHTGVTIPLHQEEGHYRQRLELCLDGGGFADGSMMYFCNPVIKVQFVSAIK